MQGVRIHAGALAVGAVLAASGAASVAAEPGRDGSRFLASVREYDWWVRSIPDAVLVQEGEHACRWLADQPVVTGRASGRTAYDVFSAFIEDAEPTPTWRYGTGRGFRGTVTYAAWHFLCPGLDESRTWAPPIEDD